MDIKGLRKAPEPDLLADTVIPTLRPRQKGSHEFQVQGEILSQENQWLAEGGSRSGREGRKDSCALA